MEPLHEGLERVPLFDTTGMISAGVCLDSGKWATEACGKDGRGISRVASAMCYPEDSPSGSCNKHFVAEVCSGGGVSTEWCKKFAEVDETVKIQEIGMVHYTGSEYNAAASAMGAGFVDSKYVVTGEFDAEENKCPAHTQETWDAYVKQKEEEERKKKEEEEKKKLEEALQNLLNPGH